MGCLLELGVPPRVLERVKVIGYLVVLVQSLPSLLANNNNNSNSWEDSLTEETHPRCNSLKSKTQPREDSKDRRQDTSL